MKKLFLRPRKGEPTFEHRGPVLTKLFNHLPIIVTSTGGVRCAITTAIAFAATGGAPVEWLAVPGSVIWLGTSVADTIGTNKEPPS